MGRRSNLNTSEDSQPMISYRLASHDKPLGPIIKDIYWQLKSPICKGEIKYYKSPIRYRHFSSLLCEVLWPSVEDRE